MSSFDTNKKAKVEDTNSDSSDDFVLVKKYLLECLYVSKTSPAIKAAIEGMEREQQRRERDAKLQLKFSQAKQQLIPNPSTTPLSSSSNLEDSIIVLDTPLPPLQSATVSAVSQPNEEDEMMEWQEVADKKDDNSNDDSGNATTSYLGKTLVKLVIESLSSHQVMVRSPLAAITVVFHASLRSEVLGFCCTGIPQEESSSSSGFAAPVRELPKTQFLPRNWDETTTTTNKAALRYRKDGTGAMILTVRLDIDGNVTVRLDPASNNNNKEPSSQFLTFPLCDHVNLDSWNAAVKSSGIKSIPPALHYKSLSVLLTNFCRTFDLGSVGEDQSIEEPYVDNTARVSSSTGPYGMNSIAIQKSDLVPPLQPGPMVAGVHVEPRQPSYQDVPSALGEAFPGIQPRAPFGGDFGDDLAPAGFRDPRLAGPPGRMGGNLMGPGHPLFQGGGIGVGGGGGLHGPPLGGPGTMQPRFDLIYPTAIDPDGPQPQIPDRNRPSRTGEPNPDHLRPPNSLGGGHDNMFL